LIGRDALNAISECSSPGSNRTRIRITTGGLSTAQNASIRKRSWRSTGKPSVQEVLMIAHKETAVQKNARETRETVFAEEAAKGSQATAAYRVEEQALPKRTAQLRSERLAREAAARQAIAKPSPFGEPKRRVRRIVID
jgi:hypothetical protein